MTTSDFPREQHRGGRFVRQGSRFRDVVTADGSSGFPAARGRYHLYVSYACPWAHRTIVVRRLKGLEGVISLSAVDPIRDRRGWAFRAAPGGEPDPVNGFDFLAEAYERSDPGYDGRVSVPVLWDRVTGRIVNNDSADIVRMLNGAFDALTASRLDLYPRALRDEIDRINDRVYETVNNGVYRAGFARTQEAYEEAVGPLFESLDWLEGLLGRRRYLAGEVVTEADWRLWTTLVRFDEVYHVHFKCNVRRVVDYPRLWALARELYNVPGIAETVRMDDIKRHYYLTHKHLNPAGIVPAGPGLDWSPPAEGRRAA